MIISCVRGSPPAVYFVHSSGSNQSVYSCNKGESNPCPLRGPALLSPQLNCNRYKSVKYKYPFHVHLCPLTRVGFELVLTKSCVNSPCCCQTSLHFTPVHLEQARPPRRPQCFSFITIFYPQWCSDVILTQCGDFHIRTVFSVLQRWRPK